MITNLKTILEQQNVNDIKWILGYVDNYGKVHYKVVYNGDNVDTHNQLWPLIHHNKWRWMPEKPKHINTYNEPIDDESLYKIWDIIDVYK